MTIVILGGGINKEGELSQLIKPRLKKAVEIFRKKKDNKILVCGKYSFLYPKEFLPPRTEAEAMKEYLLKLGLPKENIYLESKSKDTISNAYYAKKLYFIPQKEKRVIVITSEFHLERTKFIFKKIFGPDYQIQFISVCSLFKGEKAKKIIEKEKVLLAETKQILAKMKPGEHNFLRGKFYKLKYYREKRPAWIIKFVTEGK